MRKRFLTVSLMGIVVLTATSMAAPLATAHHDAGPCDFHRRSAETVQHFSRRQIRCSVERFGPVPGGRRRAICIATRESGLNPGATSPTELYLGLFQHAAAYWDGRYETWARPRWDLPTSALEGRTNAIITIRMVRSMGGWRTAGWHVRDC